MNKKLFKYLITIFSFFSILTYLISIIVLIPENKLLKNKFFVINSYQYLTFNDKENINIEILVMDSSDFINNNITQCNIITIDNQQIIASIDNITQLNKSNDQIYKIYRLILSIDPGSINYNQTIFNSLTFDDNDNNFDIGKIIIDKTNITYNDKINIMSTIYSIDGFSYSIFIENKTDTNLKINDIYYVLQVNNKIYELSNIKPVSISSHSEYDIRLHLDKELENKNIIIRPIITYSYENKIYKSCPNYSIHFKDSLTKEYILSIIKEHKY